MDEQLAPPGFYTSRDVARALGSTLGGVRNLVYRERLRRAGGTERHPWYRAEDVAALLAERQARQSA
ncbi:hypothetical protein B6E66_07345 [Streptomyces maremycinicus]|nr:hypothetical protein B6E66_07345 [Streptomyces sp. B9173]